MFVKFLIKTVALTWLAAVTVFAFDGVLIASKTFAPVVDGVKGLRWCEGGVNALKSQGAAIDLVVFQAEPTQTDSAPQCVEVLKAEIAAVRAAHAHAQVVVVSPLLLPQPAWYAPKARELRAALEATLPTWDRVGYIDLSKVTPAKHKADETYFSADGAGLGERGLDVWRAWVEPLLEKATPTAHGDTSHGVVFADKGYFAGWPANGGSWVWGEEMLVCFIIGPFVEKSGHNLELSGAQWYVCMRSKDGGKTWVNEPHPELDRCSTQARAQQSPKGRDLKWQASLGVDFTHPDLAVMMSGSTMWFSTDRGHTWSAPMRIELPSLHADMALWARTAYVPIDANRCLFMMTESARDKARRNVERGHVFAFETKDGGRTFQALGQVGDFLKDRLPTDEFGLTQPSSGIMPSMVRTPAGKLIAARRSRLGDHKWTDIFESTDGGKTWQFVSVAEIGGGTPPALVYMPKEKRLVLVYANRFPPYGVRARVSMNEGKTWSDPYVLRDDAREWDIGYNRAHLLNDGRIVTFYYYTTKEHPAQFIAWSVWDVNATLAREGR